MVSRTHAIMTVMTTVSPTKAPEICSSVALLAAVGAGATLVLDGVAVEMDNVAEVSVDNLLERLEMALDCEAEILDIPDEALEAIEEAAEDAAALIEEAVELAPEASEDVTEARDEAEAEMEAVLIGATIVTEEPEMTVVRVVEPVVAALKDESAALLRDETALFKELTLDTRPGTTATLDCELCSDANAELRTVRALVVPG